MEILHFCPSRSFSGLEQYALSLARDQRSKGLDVGFAVAPGTELEDQCRISGIETLTFNPFRAFATQKFWPVLTKFLLKEDALKTIHVHSTQDLMPLLGPLVLLKALRKKRPKIILQIHIWINHKKRDPLHRFLYSYVDEIWCSSEPARAALSKNLPVPSSKIKIIKYARNIDELEKSFFPRDEARKQLGLPLDKLVLGTVSRIEKSKGIKEFFLAALPFLEDRPDLYLVIIGGPSPMDSKAEAYARDLKSLVSGQPPSIKERVRFLGAISHSHRFLKAFDLYVLSSYQECFSLSLLDAQLAGLPVVGSRSGGTPEVVKMGETGWLFVPKNVDSLTECLGVALSEGKRWESLGTKARQRVRDEFSQKQIFEEVIRGYSLSP